MKKLMIYAATLVFAVAVASEANAQGRGKGHREKDRKEYVKYQKKQHKAVHRHARDIDRSYRKYYQERDKAYRKYVQQRGVKYRDHDAWYYGKRFHRRTEYVYFPAHRTYYDPYRRGYVYQRNHAWVFTHTMPSFMAGVNLGAVNVQFMANLPL